MSEEAREDPRGSVRPTAGELILARRREAGMTQEGLAQAMTEAGEPTIRKQISEWERGAPPSARKLLAALEVTGGLDVVSDSALARRVRELERDVVRLRRLLTANIA